MSQLALKLIALDDGSLDSALWLEHELPPFFGGCTCSVERWDLRVLSYSQLNAERVLERLETPGPPTRALALIDHDLNVPGLNFVLGLAQPEQRRAVVALPRLRESFYSQPEFDAVFRTRLLKEAVHELGHTFGLGHCRSRRCVMHFSNRIADTDLKRAEFCGQCADSIKT